MMDRILVPLDGSGLGELALAYASALARGFDSEIHLVSVSEGRAAEYRRMVQVYIERTAAELCRNLGKDKAVVKTAILDGNPADRILEYAQQQRASLIITVSHGHSGILPWTMGSTAYRIVHGASVSVLIVRASKRKKKGDPDQVFRRILLPLDGSETSDQALPVGLEMAKKLKSELTLLSVVEPGQRVHTIGGQDYVQFSEQYVKTMKKELAAYLEKTRKYFEQKDVRVSSELRTGNAAEEIINLSKARKMQLVIMTSHGKSGLRQWVFGSVANKVLHSGKTPLLLLR